MPHQNRVDPWGDLHAVTARGTLTGNRGCLVDESGALARRQRGSLWITCELTFKDWGHPLNAPNTWTPLFFLDDAVALAAGHRPCGLCRRDDYLAYQQGVTMESESNDPVSATELNRRLASERLRHGRGLSRAADRILTRRPLAGLPTGSVITDEDNNAFLVTADSLQQFGFEGWGRPTERHSALDVRVLTPPTSISALSNGFHPRLHATAAGE